MSYKLFVEISPNLQLGAVWHKCELILLEVKRSEVKVTAGLHIKQALWKAFSHQSPECIDVF